MQSILCAPHKTAEATGTISEFKQNQVNSDTVKLTSQMKYLKENKRCVIPDSSQSLSSPWVGANHTKIECTPRQTPDGRKIIFYTSLVPLPEDFKIFDKH